MEFKQKMALFLNNFFFQLYLLNLPCLPFVIFWKDILAFLIFSVMSMASIIIIHFQAFRGPVHSK